MGRKKKTSGTEPLDVVAAVDGAEEAAPEVSEGKVSESTAETPKQNPAGGDVPAKYRKFQ